MINTVKEIRDEATGELVSYFVNSVSFYPVEHPQIIEWLKDNKATPAFTVEELKARALSKVDTAHATFLLEAVGNPTQVEIDTWGLKLEISAAVLSGDTLTDKQNAFLISAGYDTEAKQTAWANSVEAKATFSAMVTGAAERIRDDTKLAASNASTPEELEQVLIDAESLAKKKLAEVIALKGS